MILERIKQYIDSKGISIAAFERSVGMSNATFGKSLKNGGAIGTDKLEKILMTYPDISPNWLLWGEGEMLVCTESKVEEIKEQHNRMESEAISSRDVLLDMIKDKDRIIREQAEEIGRLKELAKDTISSPHQISSLLETDVGIVH